MTRLRICLIAACWCIQPINAALTYSGNVLSTAIVPNRVTCIVGPNATARIEMMAPDIVRVRFSPAGEFSLKASGAIVLPPAPFTTPLARIVDHGGYVTMYSKELHVVVFKNPFRIDIFRADDTRVLSDPEMQPVGWDPDTGNVFTRKISPYNEYYFGLGFRGGPLNRRSRVFVMRNTAVSGYGELSDPLQLSIPFYYGLRDGKAYGVFVDNPASPYFDMGAQFPNLVIFGAAKGDLDYYVFPGPEPQKVANAYSRLTGFMPLPPKWTLGFHQSRYGYKSQEEILRIARRFRELDIPGDAFYLDLDYMDHMQLFTWDPVNFPNPASFNAEMEGLGFRTVNIVDPIVRTDDRWWPAMADSGYFLTSPSGSSKVVNTFLGEASWIDFTKNALRSWYREKLREFLNSGVTALWNDLNEPQSGLPDATYDFNGQRRKDVEGRNLYALQEVSLSYAAQKDIRPNVRPWVLSRSGYAGIQRFAANWSGDTSSSFDSLRVSVQLSLSMGLSGQHQFGHDVGGFLGSPSPELYIRWLEFGSFTPLLRVHSSDTSDPREPWSFGEPYTGIARETLRQRYRLIPYLYTAMEAASRTGAPVIAPAFFHFPSDTSTYFQDQDMIVGAWLLVAPVYKETATTRTVYLPAGLDWYDFYTGQKFAGGQTITVEAPLERIPVFARQGGIIPLGPDVRYISQTSRPDLTLELFPSDGDTSYVLYEDDGQSFDYTKGAYRRTEFTRKTDGQKTTITVRRAEGNLPIEDRVWTFRLRALPSPPASVTVGGSALQRASCVAALEAIGTGWTYVTSEETLVTRVPDSPASLSVQISN